jgi:hypothetical protein
MITSNSKMRLLNTASRLRKKGDCQMERERARFVWSGKTLLITKLCSSFMQPSLLCWFNPQQE